MKRKIFIILVLVAAGLAGRWLFKPGYFLMHDDLQMMRQLEMEKCFKDGQIPCRWVPDMGFGYGYPLFNFYPPLPFYVGQLFRTVGMNFRDTAKALFALQFFASGITMLVLGASVWGLWGGLISAVFYIWAPYHSVDVYVRGALNEAWAFIWFPLILWSAKRLIEKEKLKYLLWLTFSFACLLLTHNVMALIFAPAMMAWIFYWMIKEKKLPWQKWSLFGKLALSAVWALGLAAFFTLPVLVEQKYTHIETMFSGYFDWRAHFTSFKQLFTSLFWGWGPSLWGMEDGMPFPVGHFHWVLGIIILSILGVRLIKNKKSKIKNSNYWLIFGLFATGIGYAFLTHQRSAFIWEKLPLLQMAQFPWRLLTGSVLFLSLLSGAIYQLTKRKLIAIVLIVGVIAFNWSFFQPEKMGPMSDEEKFSGIAWIYQQTAGIYDYLPKYAFRAPVEAPKSDFEFITGYGEGRMEKGTDWALWQGTVSEPGVLQISIFNFPGWKAWLNKNQELPISYDQELGRIQVELTEGEHEVYFKLTNTPIRSWGNLISLASWVMLILIISPMGKKWLKRKE